MKAAAIPRLLRNSFAISRTKASPQALRILMTTDAVGGVWHYALTLATALSRLGHSTALVTLGPPPSAAQQRTALRIPKLQLHLTALPLEWMVQKNPATDLSYRQVLPAIAEQFRPHLVHSNSFREAACDWRAPVLLTAHSCVNSWWRCCEQQPIPREWDDYTRQLRQGLRSAGRIVAPSRHFANQIRRLYQPSAPVIDIANGSNLVFPAQPKKPLILGAGRLWDKGKNIAALTKIAADLPWPVEMAGDAGENDAAAGARNVQMLGQLPPARLHRRMAQAEIFAHPARYEPFGLVVLEAARAGCALVLGDIPSLRELWRGAALFAPPDNPAALRRQLQRLIADPLLRRRYQQLARQRAVTYSVTAMVNRYLCQYRALLAQPIKECQP